MNNFNKNLSDVLDLVVDYGKIDLCKRLVDIGVKPNSRELLIGGVSPIEVALNRGDLETLRCVKSFILDYTLTVDKLRKFMRVTENPEILEEVISDN